VGIETAERVRAGCSRKPAAALLSVAALCFIGNSAVAQELEIAVSPSPVGSGARAAGMADAFVATADDATAASWNPAGLVQVERPEMSLVGSYNGIYEEFSAHGHPEVDSTHDDHNYDLNYVSFTYPFFMPVLGRNSSVALNYQRKYDFSRDFVMDYGSSTIQQGTPISRYLTMDFEQSGGLGAVTPAFAIEITPTFSVGASLNLWRSSPFADNSWTQRTRVDGVWRVGQLVSEVTTVTREKYRDFEGENVVVGVLWNVTPRWTLGARYDSGFTGDVKYRFTETRTQDGTTMPPATASESREVRFPSSFALGASCRASERLTLSLDVTRTDRWKDFFYETADGERFSLIDASPLNEPGTGRTHFDPTHTVRLGGEYIFVPERPERRIDYLWTLRGGLFYDQEPASGHPDDFFGFALGGGVIAHQRVSLDLAYQLRYGHDVNEDFVRGVEGFDEDVFQHRVLMSAIVYF